MNNIDKYIRELLFHYDCVIIPRFGGFVANPLYTRINNIQNMFYPPSKNIGFNSDLKINDGLLASYISNIENIAYSEALINIENITNEWVKRLELGDKVILINIGSFSYDLEKKIQFEPNVLSNLCLDSYGLPVFQAIPVTQGNKEDAIRKHINEGKRIIISQNNKTSKSRKLLKLLYLLPVFLLIGLGIVNYDKINNTNFDIASLNPFKVSNNGTSIVESTSTVKTESVLADQKESVVKTSEEQLDSNIAEETETSATISKEDTKEEDVQLEVTKVESNKENIANINKKYYIISGCFREMDNAKQYVKEIQDKGYNAFIVDKSPIGLLRVAIAGTDDYAFAINNLNILKATFDGAWLLTK
ncbi:MAG: hypothetical protein A2X12_04540 [Bacteroidetes bacterium GWE2_29_8]|nr:MAG: hypothetical protein A2X12_04540 [Bacteroidetes bacterium GWE2_29_8]OFY14442.1 MAG: hypothetical protein A2X02_01430 [Bacteroidetes bacterium GWF2_29_10]